MYADTIKDRLQYTNKKGKVIFLEISLHAQKRFMQRWSRAFPSKPLSPNDVIPTIVKWFSSANRVYNLSRKDKERIKRYGPGALYFRTNMFTFVIKDGMIITIEISDRGIRNLNKGKNPIMQST